MRRRRAKWIRFAQYAFLIAGVVALGYCAVTWWEARLFQASQARQFERQLNSGAAAPPAEPGATSPPAPKPLAEGQTIARLEIPRIGVAVMVVEGVNDRDLTRAAGHIPGTAMPGQRGNVGIAAHRDTFFRRLKGIRANDTIRIRTLTGAYRYRVISTKIVGERDVQVLLPTSRDSLTLVTCYPFNYVGAAPKRFIVRAERLPAPARVAATVAARGD